MKSAVVTAANAEWKIQDVPTPKPGPNQVLLRVRASGLCYTDVHQTRNELPMTFPRTLGHEPVGEIVELGAGVTTRKVGDRVGVPWIQAGCGRCEWCARGRPMFCKDQIGTSVQCDGGHAEFMLAYAGATVLLPEKISFEQAAPVFCAGYTVWSGLRWARPQPGDRVAVVGIGGLGHLAVQFAKVSGFHTIAVSHSPDKDSLIKDLGADEIVRDGEGLTRVGGADVILGCSNSSAHMGDCIKGVRPDGKLVIMGFDHKHLDVSLGDLIMKRFSIIGSQQNSPEYLYEALNLVAGGKVKVHTETFGLNDIKKAYQSVEQGKVRFRAVITA
jgi:alcohol dehydrogenase